jgi:hypothetical protein
MFWVVGADADPMTVAAPFTQELRRVDPERGLVPGRRGSERPGQPPPHQLYASLAAPTRLFLQFTFC